MRKTSWRPFYAASTWSAVWAQMHATMADRMGKRVAVSAKQYPPLTNAEAVAFIRVWRGATTGDGAIWHQLAANAYGWAPPSSDMLRVDDKQGARGYALAPAVWRWSKGIADELDARGVGVPASVAPNRSSFGDPMFYGEVRSRLYEDGGRADVDTGKRAITTTQAAPRAANSGLGWLAVLVIAALLLSQQRRTSGRKGRR